MRRSGFIVFLLCLILATSAASAMDIPRGADREPVAPGLASWFWTFLNDVGMIIDPWGDEGSGTNVRPGDTAGSEGGMRIDPWGDEGSTHEQPEGTGGDLGMRIDPWG